MACDNLSVDNMKFVKMGMEGDRFRLCGLDVRGDVWYRGGLSVSCLIAKFGSSRDSVVYAAARLRSRVSMQHYAAVRSVGLEIPFTVRVNNGSRRSDRQQMFKSCELV